MSRQSTFLYTILGVVVSVTAAAGGVRGQALLALIVGTGILAMFGHWLINRVASTDVQQTLDHRIGNQNKTRQDIGRLYLLLPPGAYVPHE